MVTSGLRFFTYTLTASSATQVGSGGTWSMGSYSYNYPLIPVNKRVYYNTLLNLFRSALMILLVIIFGSHPVLLLFGAPPSQETLAATLCNQSKTLTTQIITGYFRWFTIHKTTRYAHKIIMHLAYLFSLFSLAEMDGLSALKAMPMPILLRTANLARGM